MKWNNKGQLWMVWTLIGAIVILTAIALIDPFKLAILDPVLGAGGLNCAVPTDGYRSTCFALKGSMVLFVGYVIFQAVQFIMRNTAAGRK